MICKFCGGELDGNGDCPYYCEYGWCGKCNKTLTTKEEIRSHTHNMKVIK